MIHGKKISRAESAIRSALISLLMEKDMEDITTTDIIQKSGYSRSAFYLYYEDKYHLADSILRDESEAYARFSTLDYFSGDTYQVDLKEHMYEWYVRLYTYIYEHRNLYHLILHSRLQAHAFHTFCDQITDILTELVDKDYMPEGLDLRFEMYIETVEHMTYIRYWDDHDWSYSIEFIARQVTMLRQMKNLGHLRMKQDNG